MSGFFVIMARFLLERRFILRVKEHIPACRTLSPSTTVINVHRGSVARRVVLWVHSRVHREAYPGTPTGHTGRHIHRYTPPGYIPPGTPHTRVYTTRYPHTRVYQPGIHHPGIPTRDTPPGYVQQSAHLPHPGMYNRVHTYHTRVYLRVKKGGHLPGYTSGLRGKRRTTRRIEPSFLPKIRER